MSRDQEVRWRLKSVCPCFLGTLRGAAGSALTQGVAVATGLQDQFNWADVAVQALGGGVGARVQAWPGADRFGVVSGIAGGFAGAGARSLVEGTSFGDNLMSALPGIIGNTIGNAVASGITARGAARPGQGLTKAMRSTPGYATDDVLNFDLLHARMGDGLWLASDPGGGYLTLGAEGVAFQAELEAMRGEGARNIDRRMQINGQTVRASGVSLPQYLGQRADGLHYYSVMPVHSQVHVDGVLRATELTSRPAIFTSAERRAFEVEFYLDGEGTDQAVYWAVRDRHNSDIASQAIRAETGVYNLTGVDMTLTISDPYYGLWGDEGFAFRTGLENHVLGNLMAGQAIVADPVGAVKAVGTQVLYTIDPGNWGEIVQNSWDGVVGYVGGLRLAAEHGRLSEALAEDAGGGSLAALGTVVAPFSSSTRRAVIDTIDLDPADVASHINRIRDGGGHAFQRHGAHIDDPAVLRRAITGEAPDGTFSRVSGVVHRESSTIFDSDDLMVRADLLLRRDRLGPEVARLSRNGPIADGHRLSIEDVDAGRIVGHGFRPAGRSLDVYGPPAPILPTAITGRFIFDASSGQWLTHTLFPTVPK